ncbi:hypothetical protein KC317_g39 [Hortaea werneckii]|nr:hypothetical protein KC317_g39 [Hortaea werneckii]
MLARRDEYASKALITRSASDVSTVSKISTHLPILTAKVLQQNDNHIFAESSNGLQNSLSFSLHARSFSSSLLSSVKRHLSFCGFKSSVASLFSWALALRLRALSMYLSI